VRECSRWAGGPPTSIETHCCHLHIPAAYRAKRRLTSLTGAYADGMPRHPATGAMQIATIDPVRNVAVLS
jgi:hypothetical protein